MEGRGGGRGEREGGRGEVGGRNGGEGGREGGLFMYMYVCVCMDHAHTHTGSHNIQTQCAHLEGVPVIQLQVQVRLLPQVLLNLTTQFAQNLLKWEGKWRRGGGKGERRRD